MNHPEQTHWDGTLTKTLIHSIHSLRTTLDKQTQINPSSNLSFVILCALWYSSSALSSNTAKLILNRFKFPVTLTIIQFGFVALWSGLFLVFRHHLHSSRFSNRSGSHSQLRYAGTSLLIDSLGIRFPNRSTIRGTCIMSCFSIAGHVFSSMAISRVPVSTVHTIKALSPLFTVIAYAGLFGVRYRFNTYFSLLPLTLGVMLACSFDMRASGIGFLCALGSTIIFVSQNIFGKKLLPNQNDQQPSGHRRTGSSGGKTQMDKLNLLFSSSAIAFLMMIPIWVYADLSALLWLGSDQLSARSLDIGSSISLTRYFIFNGTVHFAQCILAFSILSRTSPVTYSIASLIKRVAVICIAILWFGQKVSIVQGFGMVLTFVGLYIYNQSKSEIDKGEKRRGIVERKHDLLLPTTSTDLDELELTDQLGSGHPKAYQVERDQPVRFQNPFRRESLLATSVQLSPNPPHPMAEQANSSGRGVERPSVTTRQRAPSIPTPFFSANPSNPSFQSTPIHSPPSYSHLHQHHHSFQLPHPQPHPPLPHHPFNHPGSTSLKSSPLQEPNPFRPIVNVR